MEWLMATVMVQAILARSNYFYADSFEKMYLIIEYNSHDGVTGVAAPESIPIMLST
jgi:hypothetical protein